MSIKNIVFIIAMEAEAAPLIERLALVEDTTKFPPAAPSKYFGGTYEGATVHVVTNGKCKRFGVDQVGTVPAGLSTWLSIEVVTTLPTLEGIVRASGDLREASPIMLKLLLDSDRYKMFSRRHVRLMLKPDLVINAGTAGGFKKHATNIGDTFVSTRTKNHDRRIPIPGFTEFGIGDHESHPTPQMQKALGLKAGVVTTGNAFDHTETDDRIMEENDARVKDMEAAAVAWACEQHGTPMFCVKVVTDLVDGGGVGEEEFLQNLKAASESLQDALPKVLDFVLDRPLSDL